LKETYLFGLGRCIEKSALEKAKRYRITQRTEARPIIPRMKQLPEQGAVHHNVHRNIFAPQSRVDGPVLLLAPPIFLALPFSRAKVDAGGRSCLPGLYFGREGGGGGRGERGRRREKRGLAGAAGPARGEAHKKRRQGGRWVWRCGDKLPMVAYDSRAPTSTAPDSSPRHTRVANAPWQPRDDKRSRKRGRGAPAAGCWLLGAGGALPQRELNKNRYSLLL
jgi:hypothetical protein